MARMRLVLLGPFQLEAEGQPALGHFESNKVRALLAFLAIEHSHPHPREALAELLWPDESPAAAGSNFRRSLANLRSVLGDRSTGLPYLDITRDTVQFIGRTGVAVDVLDFQLLLNTPRTHPQWIASLERAVGLYGGPLLEGFHLDDCPDFEQWMLAERRRLERLAVSALAQLAECAEAGGDTERSLHLYHRCVALDPYNECAHRGLMRALAAGSERGEALLHYAAYRRLLLADIGAQPEAATVKLADQIRNDEPGEVVAPPALGKVYGREPQLAALLASARQVQHGRGAVVLVVGQAGSGKTCLIEEFARRLCAADERWLTASGACSALLGIGDPYAPLSACLRSLLEGTDAARCAELLHAEAPTWERLLHAAPIPARIVRPPLRPTGPAAGKLHAAFISPALSFSLAPDARFDQLANLLRRLARRRPLLYFVDNLQWATRGTLALFFHLAEALARDPVLLVGACRSSQRPAAVDMVLHELRIHCAATVIDLDGADGRCFVDALIDAEFNRLDDAFRVWLLAQTRGHALLTADLLAALQSAGRLVRAADGAWELAGSLDPPLPQLSARAQACLAAEVAG